MKETTAQHLWCAMQNRALSPTRRDALAVKYRRIKLAAGGENLRGMYRRNNGRF